jgi:hypothetical protein
MLVCFHNFELEHFYLYQTYELEFEIGFYLFDWISFVFVSLDELGAFASSLFRCLQPTFGKFANGFSI